MPPLTMYTISRGCYTLPTTQSHDYCVQSQQLLLGYILHCSTVQKQGQVTKGGGPKSRGKGKEYEQEILGRVDSFFKLSRKEKNGEGRRSGWQSEGWEEGGRGGGGLLAWTLKPSMSAKTGKPISFMVERKYWLILLPPSPFSRMGCQFC